MADKNIWIPKICLNMIVRNESAIIRRLLDSVADVIDAYVIVDTGSTDTTVHDVTQYFRDICKKKKIKIPGEVCFGQRHKFIDFATNRNKALFTAHDYIEDECDHDEKLYGAEELLKQFPWIPLLSLGMDPTNEPKAQEISKTLKFKVKPQWFTLFLDADMILTQNEENRYMLKSMLTKHLSEHNGKTGPIMLLQGSQSYFYKNLRLLPFHAFESDYSYFERTRYIGVTHEYVSLSPKMQAMFDTHGLLVSDRNMVFIADIGDGGSKGDKSERDLRLLLGAYNMETTNKSEKTRYSFYIANTYLYAKKHEEAIKWYDIRISYGDWDQELFISHYYKGQCNKALGNNGEAVVDWLRAFNACPRRVESLHKLIEMFREEGKNELAMLFLDRVLDRILPDLSQSEITSFLFVEYDAYTHLCYSEHIICRYYCQPKLTASSLVCNDVHTSIMHVLNSRLTHNSSLVTKTLSNAKFYKDVLKPLKTNDFSFECEDALGIFGGGVKHRRFYSSTPSILCAKDGQVYLNIRMVNYRIDHENGKYHDCDDSIITLNFVVKWDQNESAKDLIAKEAEKQMKSLKATVVDVNGKLPRYVGVEDVRLFEFPGDEEGHIYGYGTHFDAANYSLGISMIEMEDTEMACSSNSIPARFWGFSPYFQTNILPSFNMKTTCEKNWALIPTASFELEFVYSWWWKNERLNDYGIQMGSVSMDNPIMMKPSNFIPSKQLPRVLQSVRGSSPGIFWNDSKTEIAFLVHVVSYETPRHYYHMIIVFDNQMTKLLRYTTLFKFENSSAIEFSVSMMRSHSHRQNADDETEKMISIGYSCWDQSTKIGVYLQKDLEMRMIENKAIDR